MVENLQILVNLMLRVYVMAVLLDILEEMLLCHFVGLLRSLLDSCSSLLL